MKIVLDTNCLLVSLQEYSDYFWLWKTFCDKKFVDCAISANADYIVTNDKHFNVLKKMDFPKINIIDIETFKKII